jgi:hypothetical protein
MLFLQEPVLLKRRTLLYGIIFICKPYYGPVEVWNLQYIFATFD